MHACPKKLEQMAEQEQARYRKEVRAYKLEQKRREAEVIHKAVIFSGVNYETDFKSINLDVFVVGSAYSTIYIIIQPVTQPCAARAYLRSQPPTHLLILHPASRKQATGLRVAVGESAELPSLQQSRG